MRYLTFIIIVCIALSCQSKDVDRISDDLFYEIDTVFIDSKGRLLDLDYYIFKSDLNDEETSIFLFNKFDHSLDEVNLDKLEFVKSFPFEAEGPDGTGKHVNSLNFLKDGSLFFKSYGESAVFEKNGSLINRIDWGNSLNPNGLKYGQTPRNEIALKGNELKVFGLSFDNKNREVFLDILSVRDNSVERFDIDSEKSYHNFVLAIDDPQNYTYMDPTVYLTSENDHIIISHQYSSEIFLFNAEGEYMKTLKYEPKRTPKRASDLEDKGIKTFEQIQEEYQKLLEQVRFAPPVWDAVNKRYFRLSASRVFKERKAEDTLLPELQEIKVYLSVFDAGFNLTSEVLVPELNNEFVKYFAKDGKLWVYQNFSDELGFIIFDIEQ
ncbi:DUF4221 domain-containing protein [Aquiflexum sp. LQ15W]|uniref:DUF4221 family protein n=1 Tax=Cognataquiflexum nitidum TaxID=2922272 RepID=UPI001F14201E|nr:DUF4221 family protein [Cognataquiflexum nitidum]MCH6199307.1 DUF4221 domain-containing protein [Cognataquiflexum nitidum]